jgi:uncharacterized protein YraI
VSRRSSTSINLLTLLMLGAAACLAGIVALLFIEPRLAPGPLRPPRAGMPPTALALQPLPATAPPAAGYPTLPPEWTATASPAEEPSATAAPSATSVLAGTEAVLPDRAATAANAGDGRVTADGQNLRLRSFPGTAGPVVAFLDAFTPLVIIGRTPDNAWLEVTVEGGRRGWVLAAFVEVYIGLSSVPVTGAALDASPTPLSLGEARVSVSGDNLRLRAGPGTAGAIVASLPAGMQLDIQGRTSDNAWLEVITADRQHGWVMRQFVEVFIDLSSVPVTGTAVNATAVPSATSAGGAQAPLTATRAPVAAVPSNAPPASQATATPPPGATPTLPPPTGGYVDSTYLTGLSAHARDIYLRGLSLGNRANVFSKVGDSITVSPHFLVPFGNGQFNLRDYAWLADVISFYAGGWARNGNSFANTSLAAKGGWSSFSVLSPPAADTSMCRANESPLACEYRLVRPAVALIMLGTNDVFDTSADGYRANLRRVVADSLQMGVIPVLSTIPPFLRSGYEARPDEFNAIVAEVAHEYDVPVWHYWAALQNLPNLGLSSDGVHPSTAPNPADFTPDNLQYGMTVRNLTALQVLDTIWRQVMH